jgi:predicted nucleic acid-binding protein
VRLVADASSILAAIFPDEQGDPEILTLFREMDALAPSIWPAEVANALLVGVRRNRIDLQEAVSALRMLGRLKVELVIRNFSDMAEQIIPLAHQHGLTVYDALYLEAARSAGAVLASNDGALRRAARTDGVALL